MLVRIKSLITAGALLSTILTPAVVLAQPITQGQVNNTGFCKRFTTVSETVIQRLTDLDTKWSAKRDEIQTKLKTRRDARTVAIQERRNNAGVKLDENVSNLETQATTDAQKQALAVFQTTVKAAMMARQTAVGSARETFHAGVDQLVTQRQNALQTAVATFKSAVRAAIQKAKSDCAASINATIVRQNFTASVQTAKDQHRSDIQSVDKNGAQIEALAKIRNEAIRQANQNFKSVLEQARTALKAAFPSN